MEWLTDHASGARCGQAMVPTRDGTRLNTFVLLPAENARFPVILHRTPYGIAAADARDRFDVLNAWLPSFPSCPALRDRGGKASCTIRDQDTSVL